MAEDDKPERTEKAEDLVAQYDAVRDEIGQDLDAVLEYGREYSITDEINLMRDVYYLWILWADFHLHMIAPYFEPTYPPKIIEPGKDDKGDPENVYPIFDYGDKLSTSLGKDIVAGRRSTGKYLNTIDKIIDLAINRAKYELSDSGEGDEEPEIRVAFGGHEIGQRKAFKACLLSNENVVVTNFEPGEWGEHQLRTMEYLAEKGYLPGM